jgi:acyl transferase domain-containing protein
LRALLEGSPPSALLQDPTWAHVVVLLADLCHFEALRSHGLGADVYAGHSLGEHAALVAARSLTLEDALDALMVRGRAISEITRARPGAMAAVSADSATVEAALADQEGVVVASRNCPSQTSIAGAAPQLTSSLSVLASRGLMASILATGAAYHCPEMEPAVTVVRNSYRLVDFQKPDVPIISSVDATFYSGQAMGHEAQERLAGQLVRPVRWQECIEELWRSGVRTFIEVGPGQQLAAFARSTLGARPHLAASAASVRREPLWGHLNLRAQWAARGLAVQGCVQRPAVAL